MQFEIKNINKSMNDLMRTIGYKPAYFQKRDEFSIVRPIGRNEYPRFHVYIRPAGGAGSDSSLAFADHGSDEQAGSLLFSLHVDQKKPSYEGAAGHSGDYDGPVVEGEVERIKNLLK